MAPSKLEETPVPSPLSPVFFLEGALGAFKGSDAADDDCALSCAAGLMGTRST